MAKSKIWLGIAGALALAVVAGCWTPRVVVSGHCVVETDHAGFPLVEMVREQSARLDGDFLKVQVAVRNASPWEKSLQYRFTWMDRGGMALKGVEALWNPLALREGEEAVVEGICPVPGAADYRLDIRPLSSP